MTKLISKHGKQYREYHIVGNGINTNRHKWSCGIGSVGINNHNKSRVHCMMRMLNYEKVIATTNEWNCTFAYDEKLCDMLLGWTVSRFYVAGKKC